MLLHHTSACCPYVHTLPAPPTPPFFPAHRAIWISAVASHWCMLPIRIYPACPQGHLDVLASHANGTVVVEAVEEQYARARQYVARHPRHFSGRQLEMLRVRCASRAPPFLVIGHRPGPASAYHADDCTSK